MAEIEALIAKHGYLGETLVGDLSKVAFLVIQHAPLEKQERYLPMILEAAEKGELRKSMVPMLVDRIRVRKGQGQLYGTQVTRDEAGKPVFKPIEDEPNVNIRRAEMGLGPLENYAGLYKMDYTVPRK